MLAAGRFFTDGTGFHGLGPVKGGFHTVDSRSFQQLGRGITCGQIFRIHRATVFFHTRPPLCSVEMVF
jgi:hypothetical protein